MSCPAARMPSPSARRHVAVRQASPADPASAAATERSALLLQPPSHQNGADGEAGAYRSQEKQIAFLQTPLLNRIVQGKRNRAACCVAEALDVDDDLLLWNAELLGGGQDDAAVGLVCTEEGCFAGLDAVAVEDRSCRLLGIPHGEFEHRRAVLLHVVKPLFDRLQRRGPKAAARGHAERIASAAIDVVFE